MGVAIFIQDKIDFKPKNAIKDKEGHYIMIKGSIQQENIPFVNIYTLNTGAPKHIKQRLTGQKGEIDRNTIIVGDVNTPFKQWVDHPARKSVRKHWM